MSVTSTNNVEFIRSYFAEMGATSGRVDVIERFVSDERLKKHTRCAKSISPEYEIVAEQMVSEGNTVSVRGKVNGIQRGEFNGISPTNKGILSGRGDLLPREQRENRRPLDRI